MISSNKIDEAIDKIIANHGDIEITGIGISKSLFDDLQNKPNYSLPDLTEELYYLMQGKRLGGWLTNPETKVPVFIDDSLKPNQVVFHTP